MCLADAQVLAIRKNVGKENKPSNSLTAKLLLGAVSNYEMAIGMLASAHGSAGVAPELLQCMHDKVAFQKVCVYCCPFL